MLSKKPIKKDELYKLCIGKRSFIMKKESGWKVLTILNAVSFVLMITVNALANILPLNGLTTGDVSDAYPNLFAPAAFTFSIWGVIYLGLIGFILYQLGAFKGKSGINTEVIMRIGHYFWISSLANTAWIFSWHFRLIPLSLVLMVVILVCLIIISTKLKATDLRVKEKIFVKIPFSIYFGWITVATIANVTVFLVSIGWDGWGISDRVWTIIALGLGLIISMVTTIRHKDMAYGLVVFWAYLGILIKHLSSNGFAGNYPDIIMAVDVSLVIIALTLLFVAVKRKKSSSLI